MKFRNIVSILLAFGLLFAANTYGALVDITNPLEGDYFFSSPDITPFTFEVNFDLWQENTSGEYQYRYLLTNTDDLSNKKFQTFVLDWGIIGATSGSFFGSGDNPAFVLSDDPGPGEISIAFFPTVAEGDSGDTVFVNSFAPPGLITLTGEGFGSLSASGPIPGPIPEPATMILFGTGLIGTALTARRKQRRSGFAPSSFVS